MSRTDLKPSQAIAVAFDNVTVAIGGNLILDGVTAVVPKGSCTAVVGPNGAGKTTLLLTLLGEIPHKGKIRIASGAEGIQPKIGYVPQRLEFDRGMPITVLEFMSMGRQRAPFWFGVRSRNRRRVQKLLAAVKAEYVLHRKLGALSSGEMKRVLLALALDMNPDLLVLDEPAAGVDFQGEYVFCELLETLRRERGFTLLMVSHDLATVTHHASHVICLNHKVAAEGHPKEVLTSDTLTAIFGMHKGLVDSRMFPCMRGESKSSCCGGGSDHA